MKAALNIVGALLVLFGAIWFCKASTSCRGWAIFGGIRCTCHIRQA
jgi:hypothetical protein